MSNAMVALAGFLSPQPGSFGFSTYNQPVGLKCCADLVWRGNCDISIFNAVVVWLLNVFGILHYLTDIKVGK